jgi:transcription antitermination protein NusB
MEHKHNEAFNHTPVDAELDQVQLERQQPHEESVDIEEVIKNLKVTSRRDERVMAFFLIYAVDRFDYTVSLDDVLEQFRIGFDVDVPHNSFAMELAQGTVSSRSALDEQIKPHLKNWKLERLGCCTRLILRLSLWELQQPGATPSIVINEAIELAKTFAEKDAYKFINGILDEICKTLGLTASLSTQELLVAKSPEET